MNTNRITPIRKMNDLDRAFAPGTITHYKREPKNTKLGLLIVLVGALSVIGFLGWLLS